MIALRRVIAATVVFCVYGVLGLAADEAWLTWSSQRAEAIGKSAYVRGRVGGLFDTRLLKTERSYNYKLAATWFTPDVIRASVRLIQLSERLSGDAARTLLTAADVPEHTVVMVEIDPREGSGVIPNDWTAFLQPVTGGSKGQAVRGVNAPRLRSVRAFGGVQRRNYDYDRFWVVFPLKHPDGTDLFPPGAAEAELIVRIHDREGTVRWPLRAEMHQMSPGGR